MIIYPNWKKFNSPIIDKYAFDPNRRYIMPFFGKTSPRTLPNNWPWDGHSRGIFWCYRFWETMQ